MVLWLKVLAAKLDNPNLIPKEKDSEKLSSNLHICTAGTHK